MTTLQDGPFTLYQLQNEELSLQICPERGALVTSLRWRERELIFLDHESFLDPAKNVRGGIPILFPICGPVHADQYLVDGKTYTLKQHGVARLGAWRVLEHHATSILLELEATPQTLAAYPWMFKLRFEYLLEANGLTIRQHYSNGSDRPMPIQFGFHPYFQLNKTGLSVSIPATRYRDTNANGAECPFGGQLDFEAAGPPLKTATGGAAESADLEFCDVSAGHSCIRAGSEKLRIELDCPLNDFPYLVFWTLRGSEFVCLEPWSAPRFAMNTGHDLKLVPPGEDFSTWVKIRVSEI